MSRVVPKELLPIGSTPAIEWAIEEAAAAGIESIAVVLSPAKPLVREYLEQSDLAGRLALTFTYVTQPEQLGLADAIWQCRDLLAGQPFALLLPDNVVLSGTASFRRMVELFCEHGREVLGALELDHAHDGRFGHSGLVEFERLGNGTLEISSLANKRPGRLAVAPGETVVRTCGRFVLTPDVLDGIERLRASATGELDEVPILQEIIARRGAIGSVLEPPLFDVGHPRGLAAANAWWLEHRSGA